MLSNGPACRLPFLRSHLPSGARILGRGRVGVRLPRTPAVFERKLKWRSLDDTEFMGEAANYRSAAEVVDELHAMLVEESALGMCEEVEQSTAEERYPGDKLRVAALSAVESFYGTQNNQLQVAFGLLAARMSDYPPAVTVLESLIFPALVLGGG